MRPVQVMEAEFTLAAPVIMTAADTTPAAQFMGAKAFTAAVALSRAAEADLPVEGASLLGALGACGAGRIQHGAAIESRPLGP